MPYIEPSAESIVEFAKAFEGDHDFVVFDVETTSRDAKQGSMVEIGAVKVTNGKISDRWSTLVNPGAPIIGKQLHGITDEDVKDAPSAAGGRSAVPRPGQATRRWSGHNVGFDIAFLEAALGSGQRIEQGRYVDTLVLAREAYPDADLKLGDLARFFELEVEPNHRALPDAEATAQLLVRLASDLPGRISAYRETVANAIRSLRTGGTPEDVDQGA